MAKIKVQAQHLKPGDIVGSGERIRDVVISSINWPSSKVQVSLGKEDAASYRVTYWGKYTMIGVERAE